MAKSTRQYVFDGMEVLPEALVLFVEKRLESALTGHWQVRVAEKLRLQAGPNGNIAWDQAALLNAMDRFWADAFKTVLGRAERSIVNELVAVRNKLSHNETFTYDDAERALESMRRLMEAIGAGGPPLNDSARCATRSFAPGSPSFSATRSAARPGGWWRFPSTRSEACCPSARSSNRIRTSRPASSCRRSSPPISARSTPAARLRNTAIRGTCPVSINCFRSTAPRCRNTSAGRFWSARGAARRT